MTILELSAVAGQSDGKDLKEIDIGLAATNK